MAANRVGIIAAVTTALEELGGDLQEVSQTVMQKFFTIILAADFPDHRDQQVIVDHLRGIGRPFGLEVSLKDPDSVEMQADCPGGIEKYFLTMTGSDTPGVIRQISTRLSQEGIDITDMYAVRSDLDRSFIMVLELAVPNGINAITLQDELEQLGRSIGLSAAMQHENIFTATTDSRPVRILLGRTPAKLATELA